jgi:hypothetical protein
MGLSDAVGLSESTEVRLVRAMQLALAAMAGYGLLAGRFGLVAPAVISLAVTVFPAVLRQEFGYVMDSGLVLWITAAMFLHNIGSLGLYANYQWYDEITHTVSASLIAALGYAAFRALELHSDDIQVPREFRALFIVVFVLAAAIVWEVVEFAAGGYFTVYGIDDIVTDMIANLAGALLVAVGGTGPTEGVVGFFREWLRPENT